MTRIDTKTGRASLKCQREPHWHKCSTDRHLGFRKLDSGSCTWIARYRGEDGKRSYKALGDLTDEFGFDQAMAAALAWFKDRDRGIKPDAETVGDVCRLYVKDREAQKGKAAGNAAHRMFEREVYGGGGKKGDRYAPHALASTPLAKVRTRALEAWRDGLVTKGLTKASANRTLTTLRAALNYAVKHRHVSADAAIEWRSVQPFKGADQSRSLYLDLEQRRALLAACAGGLRDLIEAAMHTGARAGELVSARVKQFDKRTASISFTGKTGTRIVPLSPAAAALFERLSKDKLPEAFLLMKDDGAAWGHSDWDELVRDAAGRARVGDGEQAKPLPAGVCLYTLRHSWISAALLDGISLLEVSKLVGTSVRMIDKNYGHLVQSVARERLAKVAMV